MAVKSRRSSGAAQFRLFKSIVKPRLLLMMALFFCWDSSTGILSNSTKVVGPLRSPRSTSLAHLTARGPMLHYSTDFHHMRQPAQSPFEPLLQGLPAEQEMLMEGVPSEGQWTPMLDDDTTHELEMQMLDRGLSKNKWQKQVVSNANPTDILVGGIGNGRMVNPSGDGGDEIRRKKKQECVPSVAVRSYYGSGVLKRSYFANTPEEVSEKEHEEDRKKREITKKNVDFGDGPLPWHCETKYEWEDKGPDHYPRFVRTAECKSRFCFNGFFRCKPRRYKTKVLKRLTGTEAASCEEDDVSLPESLRANWKFVTVTINLCCDCSTRATGVEQA